MMRRSLSMLLPIFLAACATLSVELGQGPFSDLTPQQAQAADVLGQQVRWGGKIVATTPRRDDTCFEVVGRALDSTARPEDITQSQGRFMACAAGFYDPAVYAAGRELTVTGVLQAPVTKKVGEYDYRYPVVRVSGLYLWPKRPAYYPPPYYPPYHPCGPFHPYGPWPYCW